MTHTRREFDVAGLRIAAAGVDDPHLKRGPLRHHRRSGQPDREPVAWASRTPRSPGCWTGSPPTATSW